MDVSAGWLIVILIILLSFSAFFSCCETAFFSLDSLKLKKLQEKDPKKAGTIISLLSDPRKLLITILLGNETVNIAATATATAFSIKLFGSQGTGLAILAMLLLILIFGEITPKTIAIHHPSKTALLLTPLLNFIYKLFTPIRHAVQFIVNGILVPFLEPKHASETVVTEEEFQSLVEIGQAEGILEDTQHKMIKNALEFTETRVGEVMTPRNEIFALPVEESLDSAIKKVKKNIVSRIPVFEKNLNHIRGIIYTKDLLITQHRINAPQTIKELLHPPYFVPQDKKVVTLLREFQKNRVHIAIVTDKAGKTEGIVCLEDLLEEIFGEIAGEAKSKTRLCRKLGHNRYLVSAMMHTEDFNQRFKSQIDEEEYDTLGGVLQELFAEKLTPGEKRFFHGITFTIQKVQERRILEVMVETIPAEGKR